MRADHGIAGAQLSVGSRRPIQRNMPEPAVFVQGHGAKIRLADAGRVFQHRAEHRLQVTR
jgi:hypothetical protein